MSILRRYKVPAVFLLGMFGLCLVADPANDYPNTFSFPHDIGDWLAALPDIETHGSDPGYESPSRIAFEFVTGGMVWLIVSSIPAILFTLWIRSRDVYDLSTPARLLVAFCGATVALAGAYATLSFSTNLFPSMSLPMVNGDTRLIVTKGLWFAPLFGALVTAVLELSRRGESRAGRSAFAASSVWR